MNQEIQKTVGEGFKYVREGRILELSALPLAHTTLISDCFLAGQPITPDIRGRTLRSILRWSIDRLKPGGEHSWFSLEWRNYNTLYYFYFEGLKVAELAEKMGIADQTIYWIRSEAVTAAAKVLQEEIRQGIDGQRRKFYVLEDQYKLKTQQARKILRLLAAFEQSMPYKLISSALNDESIEIRNSLSELVNSGMAISNSNFSTILVHPEIKDFLALQLTADEKETWHTLIGAHFEEDGNYIEAAKHYKIAGNAQKSADILLAHNESIINDLQIEAIQELIEEFSQQELNYKTWYQIQLQNGDNLKLLGNLDGALLAYQKALSAEPVDLKSEAYFRRAKALFLTNLDEALAHFNYCIQLLEKSESNPDLLAKAYIGRAQIFLREDQLEAAGDSLTQASKLIQESDRGIYSYLQSAWYYLSIKNKDHQKAVQHGQQAWIAATEIADSVRMAEMSHNLGMLYAQMGNYDKSKEYLGKSAVIAQEIGNIEMLALNKKTLGGLYFMQQDYDLAISEYSEAWEMLVSMGNLNWQAHTAYDLAEVHGQVGNEDLFWEFHSKGYQLAQTSGFSGLAQEFEALRERLGIRKIDVALNERQIQVVDYLRNNAQITNREFQKLTQLSARQALRELKELVSMGLIEKEGKGRSVHYRLPTN